MLFRELSQEIKDMATYYPVVTLIGPRQSGKTTLIKEIFPNKPYVSLEDMDERNFAEADPRGFLNRFPDGAILDEIQRLPLLLSYLQNIIDHTQQNGMFILTGSHQLALLESITQSLAGRTAILKLMPLDLAELTAANISFSLNDYIYHGMYPKIYKDHINPTKFYRDYVQTYVERDVRRMINIKDLSMFQHFLKLCAGRIGQILNSHSLSNELGISYHTIANWLSILEASFLIFRLQPYYENFGKRHIKSAKIFFTDTGLASYLLDIHSVNQLERDPLRGSLVENFIVGEFIKNRLNKGLEPSFYFYRDSNQNEVDLLYKVGHQLIPIEIKSSQTFHAQFLKGLNYFKSLAKDRCPKGLLIYAGEQEQEIQNVKVFNFKNITTAMNWIEEANEG